MPTLDHDRLMARPLADLHAIARDLGIPRFRLLRKPELTDAIIDRLTTDEQARGGGARPASRRERRSRRRRGFGLRQS